MVKTGQNAVGEPLRILFRTETVDAALAEFAAQVGEWSGAPISFIVDERRGAASIPPWADKVALTQAACEGLGLYCPADFGWRCGDYGLYLARRAYPATRRFWLVENDVRILGRSPRDFFDFFANQNEDFLASYIEPAGVDWYWHGSLINRDQAPFKCFFPLCRVAATVLDRLEAVRRWQATQWERRRFWPNDEGFVATAILEGGFSWADFNDFGRQFYTADQFHFESVLDGDSLPNPTEDARLFHPVLYGDALHRKRARLAERRRPPSLAKRVAAAADGRFGPAAQARRRRSRAAWHALPSAMEAKS